MLGEMASQFCVHLFMVLGYFSDHFRVTFSGASSACSSLGAWWIVFKPAAHILIGHVFQSISYLMNNTALILFLGKAAAIASLIPVRPSAQIIKISFTPRFFSSFRTESHYLEPSLFPTWIVRTSLRPSRLIPRKT